MEKFKQVVISVRKGSVLGWPRRGIVESDQDLNHSSNATLLCGLDKPC